MAVVEVWGVLELDFVGLGSGTEYNEACSVVWIWCLVKWQFLCGWVLAHRLGD